MKEFFRVYNKHHSKLGLSLNIFQTSIGNYCIHITYKQDHLNFGKILIKVVEMDYELAFAKAQVELKDWLVKHNDGY